MRKYYLLFILLFSSPLFALNWQELAPGLSYAAIPVDQENSTQKGQLHAFNIDLNHYQLDLATATDIKRSSASAKDFGQNEAALVAINGGFFEPDRTPLGLRVKNGKTLNPLRSISWWSVFYIKDNKAYIQPVSHFKASSHITFAVQAGPRLLVNGKIPALKPGFDERSAICIRHDGHIILAATENTPLSTQGLAKILYKTDKENGLNCVNALNLDGGSSTQLYAHIKNFELDVPNFNTVSDAIIVKAR